MASFLSQVAKITDNLYLSSFIGAAEPNLQKYNITCVITVCREVPQIQTNLRSDTLKQIESIKLDVLDKPTESLARYFDYVADKINEVANKKGVCLVHCVAGISRSATMVIVYLMKHLKMSLKEAHALVKSRRPFIRPNLGFWRQMVDYELSLFGTNSVRIIPSNIGFIPDIYEAEVKNMQWTKNVPQMVTMPPIFNANFQNQNNNSNVISNNYNSYKEKLKSGNQSANINNVNSIQPIVGNAISKFSRNPDQGSVGLPKSEMAVVDQKINNKSHYTTTYRSSYQYQKP